MKSRVQKAGFTLIELLTVISATLVLITMLKPAFSSLGAQGFTGKAFDVDYLIRLAKTRAMSQNTFVWVGFQPITSNGNPALAVAIVESTTGGGPTKTGSGSYVLPVFQLVAKPAILANIQFDTTRYLNLQGVDKTNNVDIAQSKYTFTQILPGLGSTTFTRVIAFSPDGSVSVDPSVTQRLVGLGLQMAPESATTAQVAAIQISGLSGRSTIVRQ